MFTLTFPFNSPTDWRLYPLDKLMALSSASAERALSKLQIVKNRLRTCMSDQNQNQNQKLLFELHFRNLKIASLTLPMITCRHRHHPGD